MYGQKYTVDSQQMFCAVFTHYKVFLFGYEGTKINERAQQSRKTGIFNNLFPNNY